ncbi:MAG: sensor histidine kinase [Myxococcota bacterium]
MGVWALLTEPSRDLKSPHHRRQARLMATVLVFIVPLFAAFVPVAAVTRSSGVDLLDLFIGGALTASGVVAWALTRTRNYRRGAMILTFAAIFGATIVGLREPDPVRAIFSTLLSLTGPLYASFLLSIRATVLSSLASLTSMVVALALNGNVSFALALTPIFFAMCVLGLTIVSATLRERHVEELEASSTLLRTALDASQDAAIIVDPGGRVSEWSLVAARLLGVEQRDALGKELSSLVRLDGAPGASPSPRPVDLTATRLDGTSFPCEGLIAALPDGRSAVFLRDVSERKQMEARLMMSDRLETMGRMVAGVAHEINNPLAYITSNLNFLVSALREAPPPVEEMADVLKETVDGARRINSIVQDLRVFSRSGEFESVGPVDLEAMLESVFGIAHHRLKESKATLKREYAKVGAVWGIESRLAQVFLNLVVNAAQAVEGASEREIVVSTYRDRDRVFVTVRDSGPGIPDAARKKLFSPFFTTKPAGQGTGLGLYISQSIISGLRGELRLAPSERGTCFEVMLPGVVTPDDE